MINFIYTILMLLLTWNWISHYYLFFFISWPDQTRPLLPKWYPGNNAKNKTVIPRQIIKKNSHIFRNTLLTVSKSGFLRKLNHNEMSPLSLRIFFEKYKLHSSNVSILATCWHYLDNICNRLYCAWARIVRSRTKSPDFSLQSS